MLITEVRAVETQSPDWNKIAIVIDGETYYSANYYRPEDVAERAKRLATLEVPA